MEELIKEFKQRIEDLKIWINDLKEDLDYIDKFKNICPRKYGLLNMDRLKEKKEHLIDELEDRLQATKLLLEISDSNIITIRKD